MRSLQASIPSRAAVPMNSPNSEILVQMVNTAQSPTHLQSISMKSAVISPSPFIPALNPSVCLKMAQHRKLHLLAHNLVQRHDADFHLLLGYLLACL